MDWLKLDGVIFGKLKPYKHKHSDADVGRAWVLDGPMVEGQTKKRFAPTNQIGVNLIRRITILLLLPSCVCEGLSSRSACVAVILFQRANA